MRLAFYGLAALLALQVAPASAALFRRNKPRGGGNISLRKRLHVNTLITEPGTIELDWSSLYSLSTTDFSMPATVKYTPEGSHILWGRTEYSVGFDTLDNSDVAGQRLTQFSQSLTLTATSVLHDGPKFDLALAPQAGFFLRDGSGVRLGATAIARYDSGRNSVGATAGWSAGTRSSPDNPAGVFDLSFGYGRNLSGSPLAEKFTPHFNAVCEKATGLPTAFSFFEGIEYQMTERIAFDLSAQHLAVAGAPRDHQAVFGLTVSLGRPH